jgi:hypothetical protein
VGLHVAAALVGLLAAGLLQAAASSNIGIAIRGSGIMISMRLITALVHVVSDSIHVLSAEGAFHLSSATGHGGTTTIVYGDGVLYTSRDAPEQWMIFRFAQTCMTCMCSMVATKLLLSQQIMLMQNLCICHGRVKAIILQRFHSASAFCQPLA